MTPKTWVQAVRPFVEKCEVAEKFNAPLEIHPVGAGVLKSILLDMARLLDRYEREKKGSRINGLH